MKKRIERPLPLPPIWSVILSLFQRKAHEKEDWEKLACTHESSVKCCLFQRKAHEKEDWEYYTSEQWTLPQLCLFQRKAHEKEDWESGHSTNIISISIPHVSEKSSWKRGLREFSDPHSGQHSGTSSFREKLMKKRIESFSGPDYGLSNCLFVSEKSSWKRGLRVKRIKRVEL